MNSNINIIYQAIAKQITIGIVLLVLVSGFFLLLKKIKIGYYGKSIYIILILCAVSSAKYCIDIYGAPFSLINLKNLNYYRSNSKTSYYELDLSGETNISQCMLYTPTSFNYGKCVIYINDKGNEENLNSISFYRDIVINEGNSFMILGIDINNIDEAIENIDNTIQELKKDDDIKEAILMGEEKGGTLSLLFANSKSTSIDGLIALYPSENFVGDINKEINIPTLIIQGDNYNSNSKEINEFINENDKKLRYIKIPRTNDKFNDTFIRASIIGDKFEKEFVKWMRMDL